MNINYLLFFKANLFLTIAIFLSFLWHYHDYTLLSFSMTFMGAISSAIILYLLFYLLLFIFSFSKKLILYLSLILFVFTDISLIIDFFIYQLFHFHINAMVLNIFTSPDALDSIQAGVLPVILVVLLIVLFIYLEFALLRSIQKRNISYKKKLNRKINKRILVPFFILIVVEKTSFGVATLFSKNELIIPFKVIPLYQPFTFNRLAVNYFGFHPDKKTQYSLSTKSDLNYPLKPLAYTHTDANFNIFIIASDSVNTSILTKELTPHIHDFSKESISLEHHYSGGNSTRFGIFSLIYGLNATYWFSFLNSNQKPVLFDVLQKQNYDISIISSTNTNWPEFRKTCYVDIQDDINDTFSGKPWKKDAQSTNCFLSQLKTLDSNKKHFTFLFLDSPHGYSYPPEANIYHAKGGDINYLAITEESDELKNVYKRYKNAVVYNDMLFGKMIQQLKDSKLYDNALIIYTSDHGQEFFEQGHFGHNTAFSKPQLHVPFMIKLPKSLQEHGLTLHHPESLTSHQDIVPTLLSLLGVTNNPSDYSNGFNIFDKNFKRAYLFSSNWNNNAIITQKSISVFSNMPNKIFTNEVRNPNDYTPMKQGKTNSKYILDVINENKKFLK